jgi:hypothetical protein
MQQKQSDVESGHQKQFKQHNGFGGREIWLLILVLGWYHV